MSASWLDEVGFDEMSAAQEADAEAEADPYEYPDDAEPSQVAKVPSEQVRRQLQDGCSFILDAPTTVPSLWGEGQDVLWAAGESLIIVGPQGVGKSTVAQQLVLARAGILAPELIGFPVKPDTRPVLYLACDRPRQIARSFRRMVDSSHADVLRERLLVWPGPLPFNLMLEPEKLAEFAEEKGAGTVVIDSLKDIAWPLTSDDVGSAVNRALGHLIARDIEAVVVHHNRKATAENKKPRQLADVYGSVWITSGAGSVISLWGEAGDPLVEMAHLKQPAEDVGPLELVHDHDWGRTTLHEQVDARSVLLRAGDSGATVAEVAEVVYGKFSKAQREKARRSLEKFADIGWATRSQPPETADGKFVETVYRRTAKMGCVTVRDGERDGTEPVTGPSRNGENPAHTRHAAITLKSPSRSPLVRGAARDGGNDGDDRKRFSGSSEYSNTSSGVLDSAPRASNVSPLFASQSDKFRDAS